jgi:hypothetical protein
MLSQHMRPTRRSGPTRALRHPSRHHTRIANEYLDQLPASARPSRSTASPCRSARWPSRSARPSPTAGAPIRMLLGAHAASPAWSARWRCRAARSAPRCASTRPRDLAPGQRASPAPRTASCSSPDQSDRARTPGARIRRPCATRTSTLVPLSANSRLEPRRSGRPTWPGCSSKQSPEELAQAVPTARSLVLLPHQPLDLLLGHARPSSRSRAEFSFIVASPTRATRPTTWPTCCCPSATDLESDAADPRRRHQVHGAVLGPRGLRAAPAGRGAAGRGARLHLDRHRTGAPHRPARALRTTAINRGIAGVVPAPRATQATTSASIRSQRRTSVRPIWDAVCRAASADADRRREETRPRLVQGARPAARVPMSRLTGT